MREGSGVERPLPRPHRSPAPNLHSSVEVAVDCYVVGSTTLAFCEETKGVRSPAFRGKPTTGKDKTMKESNPKNQSRRDDWAGTLVRACPPALASLNTY